MQTRSTSSFAVLPVLFVCRLASCFSLKRQSPLSCCSLSAALNSLHLPRTDHILICRWLFITLRRWLVNVPCVKYIKNTQHWMCWEAHGMKTRRRWRWEKTKVMDVVQLGQIFKLQCNRLSEEACKTTLNCILIFFPKFYDFILLLESVNTFSYFYSTRDTCTWNMEETIGVEIRERQNDERRGGDEAILWGKKN